MECVLDEEGGLSGSSLAPPSSPNLPKSHKDNGLEAFETNITYNIMLFVVFSHLPSVGLSFFLCTASSRLQPSSILPALHSSPSRFQF